MGDKTVTTDSDVVVFCENHIAKCEEILAFAQSCHAMTDVAAAQCEGAKSMLPILKKIKERFLDA